MKKLIRKILKEETSNFNKFELGAFKIIDKIGIEKFIDEYLRDMELDVEEEINLPEPAPEKWDLYGEY